MKVFKNIIYVLAASSILVSCKLEQMEFEKESDTKQGVWLSIQKAADGTQGLTLFPQIDERKETFNVNFGALGLPAKDVVVDFTEDKNALDSINRVRTNRGLEPYLTFPAGSYTLDKTAATIKKGEVSSDLVTLTYKPQQFDLSKQYLLPLKAVNRDGYAFREGGQTVYFLAAVIEKLHPKAGWVATASSEQLSGETTGLASAVIDGNINTYWHSPYNNPANIPFPHWLEIDFKSDVYVTKIGLTRRQNNVNGFKTFDIEGSKDGTTWVKLANNQVMDQNELEAQFFTIEPQYLKKIKIALKDNFNGQTSTHLAEFDVFGY